MAIGSHLFILGYRPRLNAHLNVWQQSHFSLDLACCWQLNQRVCWKLSCGEGHLAEIKAPYHVSKRGICLITLNLDKGVSLAREEDQALKWRRKYFQYDDLSSLV